MGDSTEMAVPFGSFAKVPSTFPPKAARQEEIENQAGN